jgi:hypothetical protein
VAYTVFGSLPGPPPGGSEAAVAVRPRDGFVDPPGPAVRQDVLAAVGGPEPVRAGALADLLVRIEAAGHAVEIRDLPVPPRRATPGRLHREGSGRFWLFRRHPERFPLPRPHDVGPLRYAVLALGALRANGRPTRRT